MPKDSNYQLRKQKLTTGAKVILNPNGNLTVNGVVKTRIKRDALNLIKRLGIRTDKVVESPDKYIRFGHTGIHRLLTAPNRDQDRADWIQKGWDSQSRFVVIHLDDNPANFNIDNLRNAPQSLNLMLKKSKGSQIKNGKWHASFNVKTGKQVHTPVLETQAEALHAVDILKLQSFQIGLENMSLYMASTVQPNSKSFIRQSIPCWADHPCIKNRNTRNQKLGQCQSNVS